MNVAIILAGGSGTRVGADCPKQFLMFDGKPILAYTVELFESNENIDAIEIVCHNEWIEYVNNMVQARNYKKVQWIVNGGDTFQDSTVNGVLNLKNILRPDDIVVISFGVSPLTPQDDINDNIRVCREHGNAIASKDIDLCTCLKDDDQSSSKSILREELKGFANPWSFLYGELLEAYELAIEKDMLKDMEPHTTSLYFALGKRLWFSQCTSPNVKITTKQDLDVFEGLLMLKKKREKY